MYITGRRIALKHNATWRKDDRYVELAIALNGVLVLYECMYCDHGVVTTEQALVGLELWCTECQVSREHTKYQLYINTSGCVSVENGDQYYCFTHHR